MRWFHRPVRLDDRQLARLPELLGRLHRYDGADLDRLAAVAADLLARRDWTPARGFELTGDMRLGVAVTAAVLAVGLAERDPFANVSSIVVHPSTMVDRRPRPTPMRGVITETPRSMSGHTSANGPVFLSWKAVERDARTGRGNVVLHEFAHKLDAATSLLDGTPQLATPSHLERWVRVCTRVYTALQSNRRDPVLRPYAATNPTEFFAVTTEAFFVRPLDLRLVHADLYEVFVDFFAQDPARVDQRRGIQPSVTVEEADGGDDGPTTPA